MQINTQRFQKLKCEEQMFPYTLQRADVESI